MILKMKVLVCISILGTFVLASGNRCENGGGVCKNRRQSSCKTGFETGRCPGASHIQCCYDSKCKDQGGSCLDSRSQTCSGGRFSTGLCPGPAYVKCCKSTSPRSQCEREGGQCLDAARDFCDSAFQSGKCPGRRGIQCCISGKGCGNRVKNLALRLSGNSKITFKNSHSSGVSDSAYASLNIRDTAQGKQAARSAYRTTCPSGAQPAPGKATCLREPILKYLEAVAAEGTAFTVNSLAGGCHGTSSLHYEGRAVDLSTRGIARAVWQKWMTLCRQQGGFTLGPGDPGHDFHVHCQIK